MAKSYPGGPGRVNRKNDTHDPEIPEEIFELARRLREMEH
jgi:hypothetical protein